MKATGHRILAAGVTVSNDTWETGLANNDLIIGPTGGGKTRGYVLPNLLSTKESFIVTDTKAPYGNRWAASWNSGAFG